MPRDHAIRDRALDAATILIAIAAVALSGSILWDRFNTRPVSTSIPDRPVEDWASIASQGHRLGAPEAQVEVLAFIDYECPYCARAEPHLRALRAAFPEDVAVIYRHLPLPNHPMAYTAAKFVECAAAQRRFEVVHDLLYSYEANLGNLDPKAVAAEAGLVDLDQFIDCAAKPGKVEQIEMDIAAAEAVDAPGTPTIIVEGILLGAPPDSTDLFDRIERLLNEN